MIGIDLTRIKPEDLNGIYREIFELCGPDVALKMFDQFRGMQITFPVRYLAPPAAKRMICDGFDGTNCRDLARRFGYSERWVRQIILANEKTTNNDDGDKQAPSGK